MPRRKNGATSAIREPDIAQADRFAQETLSSARAHAERCLADVIDYARTSPEKALLSAVAGGYVLRMLPLTRILAALVGVALLLLKPAALIFGVAKLWQKVQVRSLR